MSRVVLDTDIVSFLFKNDSRIGPYREFLTGQEAIISFMTLAELRLWALLRQWGAARCDRLDQHIRHFAVHPYDPALCSAWADVTYLARTKGRRIETADAWIAATARLHQLPLVTHNASDYAGVDGLKIVTFPQ